MTDFLYHVTLTTGHVRKTYPHEVDQRIYFVLRRILRESQLPAGAELLPGYTLRTTIDRGEAIATIFADVDESPILTTACSPTGSSEVWRVLHESSISPLATNPEKPPAGAYIADRLEIGAMLHMDALQWTGDFSRCFGWIVISPEKIR